MTHEELLVDIDAFIYEAMMNKKSDLRFLRTLRTVVDLHPMWTDYKYTETDKELVEFCGCCQEKYPCKTIQAIESALR
jgi:hypothetical protein